MESDDIFQTPMPLTAADSISGPESGEYEFDTAGPDGRIFGCIDLKCLVPGRWNTLEYFQVMRTWEKITDFDPYTLREQIRDVAQAVLVDIFLKDH